MNKDAERVLCIDRKDLPVDWLGAHVALEMTEPVFGELTCALPYHWRPREEAETADAYKQLIPYAVLFGKNGAVGCYQRRGSEGRLHDLWSVGIGGHINPTDAAGTGKSVREIVRAGLFRELREEISTGLGPSEIRFSGIINEEETPVGRVHLGIVFQIDIADSAAVMPGAELFQFGWQPVDAIGKFNLELWSRLALRLLAPLAR